MHAASRSSGSKVDETVNADDARFRTLTAHRTRGGRPFVVVRAPGRVNLIGEHTDYNDGFVLPMAVPLDTVIVASPIRGATRTEIFSEGFGSVVISPQHEPRNRSGDETDMAWAAPIRGVLQLLAEMGIEPSPWLGTIGTDIPIGAGLSSSAAVEVATALTVLTLAGVALSGRDIAILCRRVENEILGVPSGIMDQLVSATAVAGHGLLIDCRTLETTPHPIPSGASVVILDTGTRRQLITSAFAERRATCERAAALLGVASLRDATLDDLGRLPRGARIERRRARHVIAENQRALDAAAAMTNDDPTQLGALMSASHRSLRDDFEVSSPELDEIVGLADAAPGCFGARMTGGGFAGCAVALVELAHTSAFVSQVEQKYQGASGLTARIWTCEPAAGASVEELP